MEPREQAFVSAYIPACPSSHAGHALTFLSFRPVPFYLSIVLLLLIALVQAPAYTRFVISRAKYYITGRGRAWDLNLNLPISISSLPLPSISNRIGLNSLPLSSSLGGFATSLMPHAAAGGAGAEAAVTGAASVAARSMPIAAAAAAADAYGTL